MYVQVFTQEDRQQYEMATIRRVLRQELTRVYSRMTVWIDDMLIAHFSMPLWATDYRDPGFTPSNRPRRKQYRGRFEEALDIFTSGSVQLPLGRGGNFTVASQHKPGEKYRVYLHCVPYGPGWSCDCYDPDGWAAKDCAGICKHILAAMVAYYVLNYLAQEGLGRKTA